MEDDLFKELEKEFWEVFTIYQLSKESFLVAEYLKKTQINNAFFSFTYRVNWRIAVVEVVKYFEKGGDYNINSFINKFNSKGKYRSAKLETNIRDWKNELLKHKNCFENLILQRNKIYAHKDLDGANISITATFDETRLLLDSIAKVLREIYSLAVFKTILPNFDGMVTNDLELVFRDLRIANECWNNLENSEDDNMRACLITIFEKSGVEGHF